MDAPCSMNVLCETKNGKIYSFSGCENKLVFAYKNIIQTMTMESFEKFCKNIDRLQLDKGVTHLPGESRIHIRSDWSALFYSFTKNELVEIKTLLQKANFKLKLYERYILFLN
jgi:hypothetical protein